MRSKKGRPESHLFSFCQSTLFTTESFKYNIEAAAILINIGTTQDSARDRRNIAAHKTQASAPSRRGDPIVVLSELCAALAQLTFDAPCLPRNMQLTQQMIDFGMRLHTGSQPTPWDNGYV
jgi:hypothetical protein